MTKKDKNKIIIWIIVGVIVVFLIYQYTNVIPVQTKETIQSSIDKITAAGSMTQGPGETQGADFISVQLYDSNKNILADINTFVIVQGVKGVEYISMTLRIRNTGDVPLSCVIKNTTTPLAFYNSFNPLSTSVAVGGPTLIRTGYINASLFEGSAVSFNVVVSCSSIKQTLPDKTGTIALNITRQEQAGFEVDILPLDTEAKVYKVVNPLEGASSLSYNNMSILPTQTKNFEIQFGATRNYCPTPVIICLYPSYINDLAFTSFDNGRVGSYEPVALEWVNDYIQYNPQFDSSTYTGFFIQGVGFKYPETITISDPIITLGATLTTGSILPVNYEKGGLSCGISCDNLISSPFSKLYFNNANGV